MRYILAQTAFAAAFGFSILGCGDSGDSGGSESNHEPPPFEDLYPSDGSDSDGWPDDFYPSNEPDGSCDIEDYKTVNINGKTWMAENLNCYVPDSKCYGDEPANCQKYGRLYDWDAARSVCPAGWRLPSNADWDKLDDTDGFSALLGGGGYSNGFYYADYYGYWWTASEYNAYGAYYRAMSYASDDVDLKSKKITNKSYLFSVRCVQN